MIQNLMPSGYMTLDNLKIPTLLTHEHVIYYPFKMVQSHFEQGFPKVILYNKNVRLS